MEQRQFYMVAFLIFKMTAFGSKKYYDGYDKASKAILFSMVKKSMVSAMLGKAIMEGHIKGLDQPVSDFYLSSVKEWQNR